MSLNESERRLLLAIARMLCAPERPYDPYRQLQRHHDFSDALAAVEAEKPNENAKSPARDTPGGAGGGDPLPQPQQANCMLVGDPRFYCRAHDCGEFTLGNMPFGYCREHVRQASTGRPKPPDKAGFPPMGTYPNRTVFNAETARADQAKAELDKAKADLARLSLVHQQLRESLGGLTAKWCGPNGYGQPWQCANELRAVLAASTTETPP